MRNTGTPRDIPPPLELACLKALWALQEGSVRQVQQVLEPHRTLAYTTVMTLLERLSRKGVVARRKAGRAFVYAPAAGREALRRAALKQFVDAWFDGSEQELLAFLTAEPAAQAAAAAVSSSRHLDAALL
jgi:predicted transcriptional regulator